MRKFSFYFYLLILFFFQSIEGQNKDDLILIQYPHISQEQWSEAETSPENRYIVIDCNADITQRKNTNLYKREDKKLVATKNLPKGSSFSVAVSNFPYSDAKTVKLLIQNEIYAYSRDFEDLYKENSGNSVDTGSTLPEGILDNEKDTVNTNTNSALLITYLKTVYDNFNHTNMNISDFQEVQKYKKALADSIRKYNYPLSSAEEYRVTMILQYYPEVLVLTPFPRLIEDADAIKIELEIGGESTNKIAVARYEVSKTLAVRMNTNIFLSGLTNSDEVYFEETDNGEKYVKLEEPDKTVLGLGLNAEVAYQTGGMLRPTMNFGFMLPLGQDDLTPYFTLGPGISYGTARVKLALSGGWAFGKVNQIKDRYKGVDLSTSTEEAPTYTDTGWKSSWQISLGLGFNLD